MVNNQPAILGDPGSVPGLRRSSGEGHGNTFPHSCLENPMQWGTWRLQSMGRKELNMTEQLTHTHTHWESHFSSVQSLCCVWLCDPIDCSTPGLPVHRQLLEFTQLMSIESVMPSNYLILVIPFSSCLQSFPASGSFQMSQFFTSSGQSIGVSASASVLPMNIQDWFPLGWTGWISLQSKELLRVFSNTTVQKHQFFGAQLSF